MAIIDTTPENPAPLPPVPSTQYSSSVDQEYPAEYQLPVAQESTYPIDAIPPLIRGAIDDVWDELRASKSLIATAALGVVATACQGFIDVKRRPTFAPSACSLFLIAIAGVSEAKTEVMRRFMPALQEFERNERRRETKETPRRKLVYGGGTYAGFRNGLQDSCRAAGILSAEAGNILNHRLITQHMTTWNALWSGDDLREDYTKVEYFVESPRWTAAFMLQPSEFMKFMSGNRGGADAEGNGFLARALVAESPKGGSPKINPDYMPSTMRLEKFHQRMKEILAQNFPSPGGTAICQLSPDSRAGRYWISYLNRLNRSVDDRTCPESMVGFVKKLPEQAARLAALFHYFERYQIPDPDQIEDEGDEDDMGNTRQGPERIVLEIPLQAMRSAIRLCDWYMLEHQRLFVHPGTYGVKSKAIENHQPSYADKVQAYAERLHAWVAENYETLKQEQRSACVRIDNARLQQARRSVDVTTDRHMAMDWLVQAMPLHYRVNFWGTRRGKYICYTPTQGGFCFGCSQTSGQASVQHWSGQQSAVAVPQSGPQHELYYQQEAKAEQRSVANGADGAVRVYMSEEDARKLAD